MENYLRERIGICQWFHFNKSKQALDTIQVLKELGIYRLRMDVSWADYHRPGGTDWYDWLFAQLSREGFELLACIWHTPPSISRNKNTNGPPFRVEQYSEFVWEILNRYGKHISYLEIWNEPNNRLKWDYDYDPEWRIFAEMVKSSAKVAKEYHKKVVLGGMSPIFGSWLDQLRKVSFDCLCNVDAVGIHAFPGQWNEQDNWGGWQPVLDHLSKYAAGLEIWVTEVGRSTMTPELEKAQAELIEETILNTTGPAYFYSALDLPYELPELEKTVDGRSEPLEHHLGLVTADGRKKPSFFALQKLLS